MLLVPAPLIPLGLEEDAEPEMTPLCIAPGSEFPATFAPGRAPRPELSLSSLANDILSPAKIESTTVLGNDCGIPEDGPFSVDEGVLGAVEESPFPLPDEEPLEPNKEFPPLLEGEELPPVEGEPVKGEEEGPPVDGEPPPVELEGIELFTGAGGGGGGGGEKGGREGREERGRGGENEGEGRDFVTPETMEPTAGILFTTEGMDLAASKTMLLTTDSTEVAAEGRAKTTDAMGVGVGEGSNFVTPETMEPTAGILLTTGEMDLVAAEIMLLTTDSTEVTAEGRAETIDAMGVGVGEGGDFVTPETMEPTAGILLMTEGMDLAAAETMLLTTDSTEVTAEGRAETIDAIGVGGGEGRGLVIPMGPTTEKRDLITVETMESTVDSAEAATEGSAETTAGIATDAVAEGRAGTTIGIATDTVAEGTTIATDAVAEGRAETMGSTTDRKGTGGIPLSCPRTVKGISSRNKRMWVEREVGVHSSEWVERAIL